MPITLIVGSILATLAVGMTSLSAREGNRVTLQRQREAALYLAETAAEDVASKLSGDPSFTTGEQLPAFSTEEEERSWVLEAASSKAPVSGGDAGEWIALKPFGASVIYGIGYVPSKADGRRIRVLRVGYDFGPAVPPAALMSNGHIELSGNPYVSGDHGNVHANGDVTGSGNPTADGYVSASGAYVPTGTVSVGDTANTGGGRPHRYIPRIDPRYQYGSSEYDLCPDGTVRAGPSYPGPEPASSSGTPCVGTTLAAANVNAYRGWRFRGHTSDRGAVWSYGGTAAYDGVYYVYQGSAELRGSPGSTERPWLVTVIAEASATGAEPHCPHIGGDIEMAGSATMRFHPKAQPLQLVAGRDLITNGGGTGGDGSFQGVIAAHEQVRLGGNSSFSGAVLAEDACDTPGSPQSATSAVVGNPTIHYDHPLQVRFGNEVRLTLWLEL